MVVAPSKKEKAIWMLDITKTTENWKNQLESYGNDTSQSFHAAPVWIPGKIPRNFIEMIDL